MMRTYKSSIWAVDSTEEYDIEWDVEYGVTGDGEIELYSVKEVGGDGTNLADNDDWWDAFMYYLDYTLDGQKQAAALIEYACEYEEGAKAYAEEMRDNLRRYK